MLSLGITSNHKPWWVVNNKNTNIVVQSLSHVQLFVTPWAKACQASLSSTISLGFPKLMPIESVMPSNHLILSPHFLLALSFSQHQDLFQWVGSSHQVAKVLEFWHQSFQWIFRTDFIQDWLVWSPCCSRDSQESSLASQFESINSSMLSLLYGPTLPSMHNYWKKHSFDCMDLCQQIDVSAFEYAFKYAV